MMGGNSWFICIPIVWIIPFVISIALYSYFKITQDKEKKNILYFSIVWSLIFSSFFVIALIQEAAFIITIILSVLFGIFLLKCTKTKKTTHLVLTVIIGWMLLITSIISVVIILNPERHYPSIYTVKISSRYEGLETIIVPMADNTIMKNVDITSGNGTICIVKTKYGSAVQINFTKNVTLYGESYDYVSSYLTMENETSKNYLPLFWIYYSPANTSNYNVSLNFKLYSLGGCGDNGYYYNGYLVAGWRSYEFGLYHGGCS